MFNFYIFIANFEMGMKPIKKLLSLIFLPIAIMSSCNHDANYNRYSSELNESINPRTTLYLLNTIEVTTTIQGDYEFVEDLEIIEEQVEEIVIERNEILEEVDEFGLALDTLGVQYFYAADHRPEGTLAVYVFLDSGSGAISSQPGGQQANGFTCENKNCCDKCVVHSTLGCPCHRTMPSCYSQNPTPVPSCTKNTVTIT